MRTVYFQFSATYLKVKLRWLHNCYHCLLSYVSYCSLTNCLSRYLYTVFGVITGGVTSSISSTLFSERSKTQVCNTCNIAFGVVDILAEYNVLSRWLNAFLYLNYLTSNGVQ